MEVRIKPPHCIKCHVTSWPMTFDWVNMKPIPPRLCVCCNNPNLDQPITSGRAPKPGDDNVVEAYCPVCNIKFLARKNWIEKIKEIKKDHRSHILPRVVSEMEDQATDEKNAASK